MIDMIDILHTLFGTYPPPSTFRERELRDPFRGIDIRKEYELILKKQSTLPATMRRRIKARMENK